MYTICSKNSRRAAASFRTHRSGWELVPTRSTPSAGLKRLICGSTDAWGQGHCMDGVMPGPLTHARRPPLSKSYSQSRRLMRLHGAGDSSEGRARVRPRPLSSLTSCAMCGSMFRWACPARAAEAGLILHRSASWMNSCSTPSSRMRQGMSALAAAKACDEGFGHAHGGGAPACAPGGRRRGSNAWEPEPAAPAQQQPQPHHGQEAALPPA